MLDVKDTYSTVTAVLPSQSVRLVTEALQTDLNTGALVWGGRGTLLQDQWWKRWVPPISPAKTMLQLLSPGNQVEAIERKIIQTARLDKQSTGAVFSSPCSQAYFGTDFDNWGQSTTTGHETVSSTADLTHNLSAIYCIVSHQDSDRVSKAAIRAGAHGPIVFYSEGRGLRDRLGWLRITKEHEKEVLLVIAEEDDADTIFDTMADAGQLHMPGRGFMYRVPISKGMFNLPSRVAHHHHEASMQQIINAIDHLAGHQHWRDQTVFDVPGQGRGQGLTEFSRVVPLNNQVCLSAIAHRENASAVINMMLEAGAPGLNFNYARFNHEEADAMGGAHLSDEFAMLRCITFSETADEICRLLDQASTDQKIADFCVYLNPAPRVATYVPGKTDYRAA
ncbi:MAG: hypothetical protein AAF541_09390 [Pseudomonadota bacterium]